MPIKQRIFEHGLMLVAFTIRSGLIHQGAQNLHVTHEPDAHFVPIRRLEKDILVANQLVRRVEAR